MSVNSIPDFDPNGGTVEPELDMDLGDHEFEVDAIDSGHFTDQDAEDGPADGEGEEPQENTEGVEDETTEETEGETAEEVEEESAEEIPAEEVEVLQEDKIPEDAPNPMIPRDRLNAVARQRKEHSDRADEALRRVAELEAQINSSSNTVEQADIDPSIIKAAAEKVLDGDTDAFATVLTDLLNKQNGNTQESNDALLERATQNAIAQIRTEEFNKERVTAADEWTTKYPSLNPEHESANPEALEEAIMLAGMYEDKGFRPGVAMDRAVKAVVASHELQQDPSTIGAPKEVAKKAAAPKRAAKKIKQPASIGQNGTKSTTSVVDTENISQDDWEALPESERERILNS